MNKHVSEFMKKYSQVDKSSPMIQLEFYQKLRKSCDDKINDIKKMIETELMKQDTVIVAKLLKSQELLSIAENLVVTEYFVNMKCVESEGIIDDILTKYIKVNFGNVFEISSYYRGTKNGCGKITYRVDKVELQSREDCEWTTFTQNDLKCIQKCYENSKSINNITLGQFKKFLNQIFTIFHKYRCHV
jgi:hypothetical protein